MVRIVNLNLLGFVGEREVVPVLIVQSVTAYTDDMRLGVRTETAP